MKKKRARLRNVFLVTLILGSTLILTPWIYFSQFGNLGCQSSPTTIACVEYIQSLPSGALVFETKQDFIPGSRRLLVYLAQTVFPRPDSQAPCEKDTYLEKQSQLQAWLKNSNQVHLTHLKQKKSTRLLARVEVGGKSLRTMMLKRSLVRPADLQPGGQKIDWCAPYIPQKQRKRLSFKSPDL